MIQFKNVCFGYPSKASSLLFNDLSFTISKGERVAIIGPNGSGKSTLIKLIMGLVKPSRGLIRVGGWDPADPEECWQVRRRVGLVFQNPDNQLIGATVMDDVAFGLENLGYPPEQMEPIIMNSLRQVDLYEERHQLPQHLSGGQKQRLAIASALAVQAELLIFDEATSMLDPKGRRKIGQLLKALHRQGITILTVTHDMDEAWEADRILLFSQGDLVADGPPQKVLTQADLLKRHGLALPSLVRITQGLIRKGLPLSPSIDSMEELMDSLCKLLCAD